MSSLAQAASGPDAAGQMRPLPIISAPIAAGSVPGSADRPVQCQFTDGGVIRDGIGRDRLHSAHHRQHDREIKVAAFLRQVGGREIDGDVLVGKPQADRVEGVGQEQKRNISFWHARMVGSIFERRMGCRTGPNPQK